MLTKVKDKESNIEQKTKYLPTNDYVFKRIFGRKGNEDIARSFLKAVTGIKYEELELNDSPILEADIIQNKMGVLDVKILADKVNNVDIEMQVVKSAYIADRILWYWSKMYAASLEKEDTYVSTRKSICILIADFELDILKDYPHYHSKWKIIEEKYKNIILTDKFQLDIIELSKLEKDKNTVNKDLLNWCKFIRNPEEVSNIIMGDKYIKKAKEELDRINADEHERMLAELREKALKDEMAIRDGGYIDGKEEGRKEGIKEGIEKGKIEIIRKMIEKGMNLKEISAITDVSIEELEKIK